MDEKFDAMVCTVGENPLPVYLGIAQLTKPNATVVLLHSRDTEKQAQRIAHCLGQGRTVLLGDRQGCLIENPWDFKTVNNIISYWAKKLPKPAINITGGTNIMTSVGMHVWLKEGNHNVIYLEEKGNLFHIGPNRIDDMTEEISVKILRNLHGISPRDKKNQLPDNYREASAVIYELFCKERLEILNRSNIKLAYPYQNPKDSPMFKWLIDSNQELWEKIRKDIPCWQDKPELPRDWKNFVKDPSTDEPHQTAKRILFASGFWLESLVHEVLEEVVPEVEIIAGQEFTIGNQPFEVDLLMVVRNRFYAISVTTQKQPDAVKGKAFEVMHRARQIGGGLARSVVVSPINEYFSLECQQSIDPSEHPRHRIIPAPVNMRSGKYPDWTYPSIPLDQWKASLATQFRRVFDEQG